MASSHTWRLAEPRSPSVRYLHYGTWPEVLPPEGLRPGLLKLAPDLAIEVLSPSETASDVQEKLDDYKAAGTSLVWVVDPERRTVMIIPSDAPVRWLHKGDTLDGGEVIPGFTCPVSEIFEGIARGE